MVTEKDEPLDFKETLSIVNSVGIKETEERLRVLTEFVYNHNMELIDAGFTEEQAIEYTRVVGEKIKSYRKEKDG